MFFSIKCRANSIGQSIRSTANDVLMGKIPPLSREEMLEGSSIAEGLELHRLVGLSQPGQQQGCSDSGPSTSSDNDKAQNASEDQVTIAKRTVDEVSDLILEDIPHGGGIVYF